MTGRGQTKLGNYRGDSQFRVRMVIVDDHPLMRKGLRLVLKGVPGLEIVGEANDGADAIWLVQSLSPDVVIMDLRMSGVDGIEATRRIREMSPKTAVIVFTVYDDESSLVSAIQAGASGYLLKDSSAELLVQSIAAVLAGGLLVRSSVLAKALTGLAGHYQPAEFSKEAESPVVTELTARALDVLELMVQGFSNKEMASRLGISESTVKRHVQSITGKMGANDRTHAAVTTLRFGIVK